MTLPKNVRSILEEGIRHDTEPNSDSSSIIEILVELESTDSFPFDRRAVTYCHLDPTFVAESFEIEDFYDKVAIVVAIEEIDASMYLAEEGYMSDLNDYNFGGPLIHSNSPEEAVQLYQESIIEVDSPEDIRSAPDPETSFELVIEGDIPPAAIVDVCRGDQNG